MQTITQESLLRSTMGYQDVLVAYAHAIVRDWGLADDVFQESLIVVSKKWETFEPDGDVLRWARGIVRFQALNILRSRRKEIPFGDEGIMDAIDKQFDMHGDEMAVARMEVVKEALRECVKQLGKKAQQLIMSFYRDGRSCRALAGTLGRTENAVRLNLCRIRGQLKQCVERAKRQEA